MIDDELNKATDDLRCAVDSIDIPPFEAPVGPEMAATRPAAESVTTLADAPSEQRKSANRIFSVAASVVLIAAGAAAAIKLTEDDGTSGSVRGIDVTNEITSPEHQWPDGDTWQNGVDGPEALTEIELVAPKFGRHVVDPTFGTTIEAVENTSASTSFMPLQVRPAFNADGSNILMYRGGDGFSLVDATTLTEVQALAIDPVDIEEVYWHPSDPKLLYFVDGSANGGFELKLIDVETGDAVTVHTYAGCSMVRGVDSHRISAETLLLGQKCTAGEGEFMVSVNVETGDVLTQPADGLGSPQPTPSSGRYVASDSDGNVTVLDSQLQSTGVTFDAGSDDYVLVETSNGQDLLVTMSFAADESEAGLIVTFDLDDGFRTIIGGQVDGYPYPPSGGGMTTSVANDGRVLFATGWDETSGAMTGEIMTVDFDDETPAIRRLAHHRSTRRNVDDVAWSGPHASLRPQLAVVVFASDWDGATSSPYILSG